MSKQAIMDKVTCKHCGSVDNYRATQKNCNLVATCNVCDKYIKNIPSGTAKPALWVGKYRGQPIENLTDVEYLKWAYRTLDLTAMQKDAIKARLKDPSLIPANYSK